MNQRLRKQISRYLKFTLMGVLAFYITFGVAGYAIMGTTTWFSGALAFGPNDPECFELGTCDLFERPFDAMIEPYNATLGDFTLVAIWAIIIGILWLRVNNTMMVGVIGVALAALFTQGFSEEAQVIGYGLLAVAIAVALYQLFIVRVHFPTN